MMTQKMAAPRMDNTSRRTMEARMPPMILSVPTQEKIQLIAKDQAADWVQSLVKIFRGFRA